MSNKEYSLSDNMVILSTSDMQGNILTYNVGFKDASGYTDDELKGKPHSILRHPDMPKEAFQDLWQTLSKGLPWFGIVKNKRKDGDYYWVAANAAPITENGRITGYVSVRYPASREQVAFAEQLYANLRAGRAKMPWTTPKNKALVPAIAAGVVGVSALMTIGAYFTQLALPVVGVGFLTIGMMGYLVGLLWQNTRPNAKQLAAIEALSNGSVQRPFDGNDYWTFALNQVRSRVAEFSAMQYDASKEAAVLTTAMQFARSNLMVADTLFNIVSINNALREFFKTNNALISQVVPHFNLDKIIGSSMDVFHKSHSYQREKLAQLTPWSADIQLASLTIQLVVTPIYLQNVHMGFMIEWLDRTADVKLEKQLAQLKHATEVGILHIRMSVEKDQSLSSSMAEAINQLMELFAEFNSQIAYSVGELAFSRLNSEMKGDYKGAYRSIQGAINLSVRNLNEIIGQVQHTSKAVTSSMLELSEGIDYFSSQTQQQASAIQQTTSAMAEMLSTVQSNAENVQHANQLAQGVHSRVEDSNKVMQETLDAMKLIHDSGSKIGDIVTLIDAIAFQTNLLALNAAVEAARAGEHGRGFAVVAGEVRALAQKSAEAAKDIKTLITVSVDQIAHGTRLVQRTSESLKDVSHSVSEVNSVVSQIAEASREQEKGIDEVNRAVTVMDDVSQRSAALVEKTAESASLVANQMEGLDKLVRQFILSPQGQIVEKQGRSFLADMKQAHLNWRIRMSNVVQGFEKIADTSTVRNHHVCGLGKWRYSDGRQFEHLPEMRALDIAHEKFHGLVGDAVDASNKGDDDLALHLMAEVDALSAEIVGLLERLEQAIAASGMLPASSRPVQRKIEAAKRLARL